MAVKKTQLFRKNLDASETNLNPLTEAQYVSMENGQTVQEILSDRDSDKYTPVITNSSSTFKVGQGDNVDLSSSMKEGAYDSCVLKGKTMVNCIQEPSSQDVVLPYEFEDGQYVTINDTKESGALGVELKGQTLVNIHKPNTPSLAAAEQSWYENLTRASGEISFDVLSTPTGWRYINAGKLNYQMLKPNTKYLVVFESSQNISSIHFMRGDGLNGLAPSTVPVQNSKAIITTNSQIVANEQILYVNFYAQPNTKVSFKNPMITEYQEGMENWDIPYFEGMTSCKMPILKTTGKNINKYSQIDFLANSAWHDSVGTPSMYGDIGAKSKSRLLFRKGTYFISVTDKINVDVFQVVDDNENILVNNVNKEFTLTEDTFLTVRFRALDYTGIMNISAKIQIEQGKHATTYEPYKSSILSLPEEVVLRSLPNGVCDTFNTRTGVYTQRIKEIVFDGSNDEGWNVFTGDWVLENSTVFYTYISGVKGYTWSKYTGKEAISDKIPSYPDNWLRLNDVLGMTNDNTGARKQFRIPKSYLETDNVNGFRKWLEQNPVTACFELATPIITKVNLSSTLKSWNITTHVCSEIPENTLYPILSHSNPTYPVILKPSTKYSIVTNSYSNNHTNSPISFNLGGVTASTTVGKRVTTVTTPSTLSNELLTVSGRGNKLNNVMVVEGDVVGDEPYFEGMCDSKSPILSNVGKNLFDINNHTENQWSFSSGYPYEQNTSYGDRLKILGDEIHFSTDGGTVNKGVGYYIPLCKNKDYTFRINKKNGNGSYCVKLFLIHSSEYPLKQAIQQHSKFGINNETITSSLETNFNSANYDMCAIYIGGGWESGTQTTRSYVFNNISLTESNQQVEPYKSNTTTFNQKDDKTIVLRSLPNGICDTLNVETGEYVQRIGEIIANGDDNVSYYRFTSSAENTVLVEITHPTINLNLKEGVACAYCDKLKYAICYGDNLDFEAFFVAKTLNRFIFRLEKGKLETIDLNGVKKYLSKNPITVQYQLATPIVSTIDVQGFPYAYTNGHVQLSSGHNGQSLTPKVEYSLSANKTGQIDNNTKRVSAHQKQLDDFEAMMLTSMVQSAYDKAILQFDYEMQMMSLGGE